MFPASGRRRRTAPAPPQRIHETDDFRGRALAWHFDLLTGLLLPQQPLIRKSRYIHEESVASRVQLRNPTTVHDRNVAVLHRACPLYGRQGTGSYLNLDLNLDETYSFLDHYDQKVLRHSLLMPMLRLREQREQPRQLTTSSEPPDLDRHFLDQFLFS
jgi:hypothetical protein